MHERRVSLIIFYDKNKKILLQDRRNISKHGEEWGFFGGKIEEGESPEQSLIREVKEELEFDIHEYKFLTKFDFDMPNVKVIAYVFTSLIEDTSKFTLREGQGMKLISIQDAYSLVMVPGDYALLKILEKGLLKI